MRYVSKWRLCAMAVEGRHPVSDGNRKLPHCAAAVLAARGYYGSHVTRTNRAALVRLPQVRGGRKKSLTPKGLCRKKSCGCPAAINFPSRPFLLYRPISHLSLHFPLAPRSYVEEYPFPRSRTGALSYSGQFLITSYTVRHLSPSVGSLVSRSCEP